MGVREGHRGNVLPCDPCFGEPVQQQAHRRLPCVRGAAVDQHGATLVDHQEGVYGQPQLATDQLHLRRQVCRERPVALLPKPSRRHVDVPVAKRDESQVADLVAYEVGAVVDFPHWFLARLCH